MEKIKHFLESEKGKDILVVIIVILVGLASFELGRLSKENTSNGVKIEYPGQEANAITGYENDSNTPILGIKNGTKANSNQSSDKNNFFASKKGKKYYSIDCSAGKTIKEENKIYFNSGEEAEKAGYTLSSACQ